MTPARTRTGRTAPPRASRTKSPAGTGAAPVQFSNLEKVLYPETGFTKGQVIDYYLGVAPAILPHLKGRPITLKRYPNGVDHPFFYEKRCPAFRPKWVNTTRVWSGANDDWINYCLVDDRATLAWMANLACLEFHTLLSRAPHIGRPTAMVFDLDPGPPADVLDSTRVALLMRDMLRKLGLESFAKTSGSKGLHLWVPLNTAGVTFERTKEFSHAIALLLEREHPDRVVSKMSKNLRNGKVLVDWSQNDAHKTTACVYTLRAKAEPTVSTPVKWEELERAVAKKNASALTFRPEDTRKRLDRFGDLFAPVLKLKQRLPDQ